MATATMKMKAGVTAVWGTSEITAQANFGIVTAASRKKTSEKEYVQDEQGYTVGMVLFDEKSELLLDIVCKSGMTEPSVGDSITFQSSPAVTGIVMDAELKWDNKSTKKLTVTATKFTDTLV